MAYHYSWMFKGQKLPGDLEFIEARWQKLKDMGFYSVCVKASVVSWTKDESLIIRAFSDGYRYNIGENEIECLIACYDHEEDKRFDEILAKATGRRGRLSDRSPDMKLMDFIGRVFNECPNLEPYSKVECK